LYDDTCAFCIGCVNFIKKHQRKSVKIIFKGQSTEEAKKVMQNFGLQDVAGIVFISNNKAFIKSTAVFEIARLLRMPWSAAACMRWIPAGWSDKIYDIIARNRYCLGGNCRN